MPCLTINTLQDLCVAPDTIVQAEARIDAWWRLRRTLPPEVALGIQQLIQGRRKAVAVAAHHMPVVISTLKQACQDRETCRGHSSITRFARNEPFIPPQGHGHVPPEGFDE
jgi:hypothetical protein